MRVSLIGRFLLLSVTLLVLGSVPLPSAQDKGDTAAYIRKNYTRNDYQIPMRDGVKLYTVVYTPKDKTQPYPIMLKRTPYSVQPYDKDSMRATLGPSKHFVTEGYIFVYQDVRGRYMSEGTFENMRPHLADAQRRQATSTKAPTPTTPSTGWSRTSPNNNGKVGHVRHLVSRLLHVRPA